MVMGTGQNGTWILADRVSNAEPARANTAVRISLPEKRGSPVGHRVAISVG